MRTGLKVGEQQSAEAHQRTIRVLSYCFILIMLLGFAELGSRIFESFGPRTFVFRQYDDTLGVSLVPNVAGVHRHCFDGYVSINAYGMRDDTRQLHKPPGVLRIGLFGDSIVESVHVYPDQVASRRLETRLNREVCDGNCEVLNFGVGGYGTLQEWLRYKRDGRRFGLDMVVLLFVGNDVANNLPETASFDQNLYYAPYLTIDTNGHEQLHPPIKPQLYEILQFLTTHSAFFRFAYKAYYHLLYQKLPSDAGGFEVRQGLPLQLDYLAAKSARGQAGWSVTERLINHFADDVRKDGTEFIVFHSGYEIPNPTRRVIEQAERYEKETGFKVDFQFGKKWFEDFSKRTGVPVFDWENHQEDYLVRNKLSDVGLGYSCDGHLNPEGQSVLADFFFEKLAPMVRAKLRMEPVAVVNQR